MQELYLKCTLRQIKTAILTPKGWKCMLKTIELSINKCFKSVL